MDGRQSFVGQQRNEFDEVELQQSEFDVRQLELFNFGIRPATDFARRALFAVGGNDFLDTGIDNAFGAVQREAKNAVQSGLDNGSIRTRADSDLLFCERLRQKFLRLERLYLCNSVVRRSILVYIPFTAVLVARRVERLQIDGTDGVRNKICSDAQSLTKNVAAISDKICRGFFLAENFLKTARPFRDKIIQT